MKYRNFFYPLKFSTDLAILTLSFLLSSFVVIALPGDASEDIDQIISI
jgi:hypothetical protein